ncbi:hypothetical protein H8A97_24525 [Bradyrhizobium sp. Arg62]|uniref:hypothetical protein n=1 Tax=Bradyrhizobium brasilense TaxID=1419277 RepID=UPI001E611C0C|nr:hypothetical protein [Bradyrhizobium brasilense]MCC8948189.1 hypothetical protein [Bradyrhizobium brasilense]
MAYGTPETFNTDHGSQFTGAALTGAFAGREDQKPADCDVDMSLAHQFAIAHNAGRPAGVHQPYRLLRIDPGLAIVGQ